MISKTNRPKRTYATDPVTRSIRRAALALIAAAVVFAAFRYPALPETIPTHYNIAGEVDGWGGRWTVLLLAAIALVLVGGLAWLSRYPHVFNYPREITAENAQAVYRAGEQLIVWVTGACSVLFTGILGLALFSDNRWVATTGVGLVSVFAVVGVMGVTIAGVVRIIRA